MVMACFTHIFSRMQTPMPTMARAYQIISQVEHLQGPGPSSLSSPGEILVFKVESKPKTRYFNEIVVCTNYNVVGHKVLGCFVLIGYPEWSGDRPHGWRGGRTG